MTQGALDALGSAVSAGLVVHPAADPIVPNLPDAQRFQLLGSAHPVPDNSSLVAGKALVDFLATLPGRQSLVALISGGASALVEVLPQHADLDTLQRLTRWLLASGLPISEMNRVRKAVSCIKGGRLSNCLRGQRILCYLISDVPDDRVEDIGSGLFTADSPNCDRPTTLPAWVEQLMQRAPPTPRLDDLVFADIDTTVIASLNDAMAAASRYASSCGYPVFSQQQRLGGDARACGRTIGQQLLGAVPGIYLWGGETTVRLPARPGRGGRCQTLALSAARVFCDRNDIMLLAAGTDGQDGNNGAAGAIVDGGTIARGIECGAVIDDAFERADTGTFLGHSNDLLYTGPTGTNVADLVVGLKT